MAVTVDDTGALEGAVASVPVPKLVTDTYINLGSAHRVKAGDYFLAYNGNIRAIAVLKVVMVMDRRSTVKIVSQLASLRRGDRVKSITAEHALDLKRQLSSLTAGAPPLGADVIIEPEMLAAASNVGAPGALVPSASPMALAPAGPDLSDLIVLARAGAEGVALSWIPPAQETGRIAGYILYRTTDPAQPGIRLNPAPITGQSYEDKAPIPSVPVIYRLTALTAAGAESAKAVTVEIIFTLPKGGALGIGGSPAQVKARNLPAFAMTGSAAAMTSAVTAPPVPPTPAAPAPSIAGPATPPSTAAPATPAPPPVPTGTPATTTPPLPAATPTPPPAPPLPTTPAAAIPPTTPPPVPAPAASAPSVPPVPPLPSAPVTSATAPVPTAPPPVPVPSEPVSPQPEYVPPAPEKVEVTLDGSIAVIKWDPAASTEPLAGYIVYRAGSAEEEGTSLSANPSPDTEYRDKTAKEGETYVYYVVAQTKAGKKSAPSGKSKVDIPKSSGAVPFF